MFSRIFKNAPKSQQLLGRWKLKHKCNSEDLVVFNANRDNCGDSICGDPMEYKYLAPRKKETKKDA